MIKIFKKSAYCILIAIAILIPQFTFAASASDPAITKLTVTPSSPAPNESVDFLVTYGNAGGTASSDTELIIDYNENQITNIVLGNTTNCINTKLTVFCVFSKLDANSSSTVGFKAKMLSTVKSGEQMITIADIDESKNKNDVSTNNSIKLTTTISALTGSKAVGSGLPAALGLTGDVKLDQPSKNQGVVVFDVSGESGWSESKLFTAGLKFMIRGKEALAWALGIKDGGFHNEAIKSSYAKVLTVVNGLFIIGLLIIAAMWMFSILIPRRYLKRVILIYGMAVIFVNFALPLNQLFIDTTNLLQTTFMDNVNITNIIEISKYNDEKAVGYQNVAGFLNQSTKNKFTLNLGDKSATSSTSSTSSGSGTTSSSSTSTSSGGASTTKSQTGTASSVKTESVAVGKIFQDYTKPAYMGTIGKETVQLNSTSNDPSIQITSPQTVEIANEGKFNPDFEHSIFAFTLMALTSIAYFAMALVFILRIVILWALMIVSPALFLLIIFRATRSYFINWLGLYMRWLLIGPLIALGLAITVNIWKVAGLPIISSYSDIGQFGTFMNIGFYLPGKDTVNTLSTAPQMMEYILFLIMLYLPIIFAFMLTKQKVWSGVLETIIEKHDAFSKRQALNAPMAEITATGKTKEAEGKSFIKDMKGFFGGKIAALTKTTMPDAMKVSGQKDLSRIESAASFLPENLALTNVHGMLDLIAGDKKGSSRNARAESIEKLAHPENITDIGERKKVQTINEEIGRRADQGNAEAIRVMAEIKEQESVVSPVGSPIGFDTKEIVKEKTVEKLNDTVGDAHMRPMNEKMKTKPATDTADEGFDDDAAEDANLHPTDEEGKKENESKERNSRKK